MRKYVRRPEDEKRHVPLGMSRRCPAGSLAPKPTTMERNTYIQHHCTHCLGAVTISIPCSSHNRAILHPLQHYRLFLQTFKQPLHIFVIEKGIDSFLPYQHTGLVVTHATHYCFSLYEILPFSTILAMRRSVFMTISHAGLNDFERTLRSVTFVKTFSTFPSVSCWMPSHLLMHLHHI